MATISVNQYTDGLTGHVNITLECSEGTYTYGANISPQSGVQDEQARSLIRATNNPASYFTTPIEVSDQQCLDALAFARAAAADANQYSIFCNNCVDFADRMLDAAGLGMSIADFLRDDTRVDDYARVRERLCNTNREDQMFSLAPAFIGSEGLIDLFYAAFGRAPDFSFTGDIIDIYNTLRDIFGPASTDDFVRKLTEEWLDNGGSPIVVDLDGNGIQAIHYLESDVRFDVTGDGVAERTAWLDDGDAFLVRDLNGNGRIDDVNEMFGGPRRGDGYAELAALDLDGDGLVTAADPGFDVLQLWTDLNRDGVSQSHELQSLPQAGLDWLQTEYRSCERQSQGNLIGEVSSAGGALGVRDMGDIYFQFEKAPPRPLAMPEVGLPTGLVFPAVDALFMPGMNHAIPSTGFELLGGNWQPPRWA